MGGKARRFIRSLHGGQRYPAQAIALLDQQRWEIELGFREIKQSLLQQAFVLRSKTPELLQQEVWGVLIAYTLIRRVMRQMALKAKVEPVRMRFHLCTIALLNVVMTAPLGSAATLPKQLSLLFDSAHLYVRPPRRQCSCPRVVKHRASKYPRKMPVSS